MHPAKYKISYRYIDKKKKKKIRTVLTQRRWKVFWGFAIMTIEWTWPLLHSNRGTQDLFSHDWCGSLWLDPHRSDTFHLSCGEVISCYYGKNVEKISYVPNGLKCTYGNWVMHHQRIVRVLDCTTLYVNIVKIFIMCIKHKSKISLRPRKACTHLVL